MNEIGRRIADKIIELHGSTDFKIAFLPYKRSMWGCMASVYEELRRSNVCACCMPIPYITIGPDGQAEEVTMDEEYDSVESFGSLPTFDPDYVVIHYQYETSNKVTHMLPWFCAEFLHAQGYKIIYIPYGYLCNHDLIMRPGFQFVDYLFLNSEDERDMFCTEWYKVGFDFTDKCFVYGSPKVDAVLNQIPRPHKGHNICGLGLGYVIGWMLKLSETKKRAISIEVGMQNSGLASSLATLHFATYPLATIPGAIFSVWHNISGAIVAYLFRK